MGRFKKKALPNLGKGKGGTEFVGRKRKGRRHDDRRPSENKGGSMGERKKGGENQSERGCEEKGSMPQGRRHAVGFEPSVAQTRGDRKPKKTEGISDIIEKSGFL